MKENIGKYCVMKEDYSNEPWYSPEVFKIFNIMGSCYVIDQYIFYNGDPHDLLSIDKVRILTDKETRDFKIDAIINEI